MDAAFEADELLKLLTDALRRGPGSPQWQQAVARVADAALPNRDEYRLLITVRERLESGKPYREVRAGPSFTRSLFNKIDAGETGAAPRRVTLPMVVMLVSLVVLIGAAGVLINWLSRGGGDGSAALAQRLFVTPQQQWDLSTDIPADLMRVGSLPLEIRNQALRGKGAPPAYPPVGAAFSAKPVDIKASVCVEAQVNLTGGADAVGVFAAAAPPTSTGLGSAELSIDCADGKVSAGWSPAAPGASRPVAPGIHTLRLKLSPAVAVAELDGQQIWSGPHAIGSSAIIGVRLTKPARGPEPGVQSLRVLSP